MSRATGWLGMVMRDALTWVDLLDQAESRHGERPALRDLCRPQRPALTWQDLADRARALAAGLLTLGVQAQDRVGVLTCLSAEALCCDLSVQSVGAVSVFLPPHIHDGSAVELLRRSRCRVLFVDDAAALAWLLPLRATLETVTRVVVLTTDRSCHAVGPSGATHVDFEGLMADPGAGAAADWAVSVDDLILTGRERLNARGAAGLALRGRSVSRDSLSAVVFTSGLSGVPKAVQLTHGNLLSTAEGLLRALPIDANDVQLLTLPLCQARGLLAWRLAVLAGTLCGVGAGPQRLFEDFHGVRPTFAFCGPRTAEGFRNRILSDARARGGMAQAMVQWALDVDREWQDVRERGDKPSRLLAIKHKSADQLVFRTFREAFGGRLRFLILAGAPLAPNVGDFLRAASVLPLEGYGLTEATGLTHVNRAHDLRPGTSGPPLPGVRARLADDGEILIEGAAVSPGYLDDAEQTQANFLADGTLKTGDLGTMDDDGRLRVTSRRHAVVTMADGTSVPVDQIEHNLAEFPLMSHVVVLGDNRPFLTALIALDEAEVLAFANEHGVGTADYRTLTQHPRVFAEVEGLVREANLRLPAGHRIRKFAILDHDLSAKTGELSPALKPRRGVIAARYAALFDSFYRDTF